MDDIPRPRPALLSQDELAEYVADLVRKGFWDTGPDGQVVVFTGWKAHSVMEPQTLTRRYWFTRDVEPPPFMRVL